MICKVCGTENTDTAKFCSECGIKITGEDTYWENVLAVIDREIKTIYWDNIIRCIFVVIALVAIIGWLVYMA